MNPVSGLHLLGVWLCDANFNCVSWKMIRFGSARFSCPHVTDSARKGFSFLREDTQGPPAQQQGRLAAEQRLSSGRWRKQSSVLIWDPDIKTIRSVNHSFCKPVCNCAPHREVYLYSNEALIKPKVMATEATQAEEPKCSTFYPISTVWIMQNFEVFF